MRLAPPEARVSSRVGIDRQFLEPSAVTPSWIDCMSGLNDEGAALPGEGEFFAPGWPELFGI